MSKIIPIDGGIQSNKFVTLSMPGRYLIDIKVVAEKCDKSNFAVFLIFSIIC